MNYFFRIITNFFTKERRPSLLIKEIEKNETGSFVAVVQVCGRPVFFPSRVIDLVKDEKLLAQFPPLQIKSLVTLTCNEQHTKPSYSISSIDHETMCFVVREISTGNYNTLSMEEIHEPYLLDGFSKKDIFKIGMMYGEYKTNLDYEKTRAMRKPELNVVVLK